LNKSIKKILGEFLGVDYRTIKNSMNLQEDLSIDQIDLEYIIGEIGDCFEVEFEYDELDLVNVVDLLDFVNERL
jgi:acyl carrier protein